MSEEFSYEEVIKLVKELLSALDEVDKKKEDLWHYLYWATHTLKEKPLEISPSLKFP